MTGAALSVVALLLLGLGLSLTVEDFRRVRGYRPTIVAALVCQLLVLPVICWGLVSLFGLAPIPAVGTLLIAAAPGGPMAGVYSHLFGGDVAFNLTLTALNSVLSLVTLPIVVGLAVEHFLGSHSGIGLRFGEVVSVLLVVAVPIAAGMAVRARRPGFAARAERVFRIVAGVAIALLVIAGIAGNAEELTAVDVLPVVVLFGLASLTTGYLAARLTRAGRRVAIAACLEIGFHNAAMAIALALGVLRSVPMAVPASLYGLIILVVGAAAGFLLSKGAP